MKTIYKYFTYIILILIINSNNYVSADITFDNWLWSTTFDYWPCTQRGGDWQTDCDKVQNDWVRWSWWARDIYWNYTQTTKEANNPIGGGWNGVRTWVASNPDESINQEASGQIGIYFPSPQKELWIRWYQRFQEGYNRNWIHYDKWLYIRTESKSTDVIVGLYPGFSAVAQNTPNAYQVKSDWDWESIMGGKYGDGKFHEYEVHIKMDTDSKNWVGQLWVDGVLVSENHNVDWSGGSESARKWWIYFDFENNQRYTDQKNWPIWLDYAYIDYDDFAIYNTFPSNKDSKGNPFIGPIDYSEVPSKDSSESENVKPTINQDNSEDSSEDSWNIVVPNIPIKDSVDSTKVISDNKKKEVPTWTHIYKTTSPTIRLRTNENTTCKYSLFPNVPYARMIKSFSTTWGKIHTKTLTNLKNDKIYTYYIKCKNAAWIKKQTIKFIIPSIINSSVIPSKVNSNVVTSKVLFSEDFENTDFASRGWYDTTSGNLSSTEHITGSTNSIECKFLKGATKCTVPSRHLFSETEEVYVSYWVKYSKNREWSNLPYHPHEFHFLTNEDDKYAGPAYNFLTAYIEQNEWVPSIALQDAKNIDNTKINNSTNTTESRAIAGCNWVSESEKISIVSCYQSNGTYFNGKVWRTPDIYFSDSQGPYYKNDWHHVEAYFKLNSIKNEIGQQDGIIKYWYDGSLLISRDNVLLRTGNHPNMKFNQFIFAPWIGDWSPVEQTFWIDNLTVWTNRTTQ